MADFRDLASQAKAAHEARVAEKTRKASEKGAARSQQVRAGVEHLRVEVIPILEKAKTQFAESGLDSRVATEFDVENFANTKPKVTFQFLGPRRADGGQFKGAHIFFESDGDTIQASISRSDLRNPEPERGLGFAPPGKIDALVEMAVRAAIDLYYRELESRGAN
jgi:hypothetical protein